MLRYRHEGTRCRSIRYLVSPCDGIVGACGSIAGIEVIQAKGFPYSLLDLLVDSALVEDYRDGCYVTLRLTSSMYHRFHAPHDCLVERVTYISGDTWNVNPIALKRVEKLFCKNERALIETTLRASGHRVMLVPVAAILVASIRLHFLNVLLHLRYRGPNRIPCHARFAQGEEMGWFQHGSTIIVFAPKGFTRVHHLFLPRAAYAMAALWGKAKAANDARLRNMLLFFVEQADQVHEEKWAIRHAREHHPRAVDVAKVNEVAGPHVQALAFDRTPYAVEAET